VELTVDAPALEHDGASPHDLAVAPARKRSRPNRIPLPAPLLAVIWVLVSLGGLAVWLLLYAYVLSGFGESSAQHALYATLRTDIAQGTAKLGGKIALGTPVALLKIPQAGVDDVVLEGTTSGVLEQGPGLEADSPLPGQAGVSIIDGRQALFGGPFRHLSALRPGDVLQVTTGAGIFEYRVMDLRYPGDRYPAQLLPGQGRLTLVTVTNAGWSGGALRSEFLYVDTALISKAVASPIGQPTQIPKNQMLMQGDPSVLFVLVLWLQLLVIVVLTLVWVSTRWAGWQTWLAGAPVVMAILWITSETAFQLLPNLL
jgi:sortase A